MKQDRLNKLTHICHFEPMVDRPDGAIPASTDEESFTIPYYTGPFPRPKYEQCRFCKEIREVQ